jgi:hypothetical protein
LEPVQIGNGPSERGDFGNRRHLALLLLLMVAAAALRLYRLDTAPLGFHPARQYRSLIIARGFYYEGLSSIPARKSQVAALNLERQGVIEPPIGEFLTASGYRLLGGESYWLPRSLSVLFWVAGAYFLYRIAERLVGATAGIIAAGLYLFVPFAVVASRSFQPDPLMIMLLLAGLLAVLRYHDRPSWGGLAAATALSALAILVKPPAAFALYTVFGLVMINRKGWGSSLADPSLWIFGLGSVLPALGYYVFYGLYLTGPVVTQTAAAFLPLLVFDSFFWKSWAANISIVIGLPAFILALLGGFLFPRGTPRSSMLGLWAGYVLFCLVFSYHIATHDYYHLQLIPIASLSLAPLLASIWVRLMEMNRGTLARVSICAVLTVGLLWSALAVRPQLLGDIALRDQIEKAEEVGDAVHHSTKNLVLASDYGMTLQYHGEVSTLPWPLMSDLEWEMLAGQNRLRPAERMEQWFGDEEVDYFIVMDMWELEQQPDLEEFLSEHYPAMVRTDSFAIFDLRGAN